MKKTWIQAAVVLGCGLGVGTSTEPAWAASANYPGYVCRVTHTRQNNAQWGSSGYVQVNLKTAALCAGSNVGTFTIKSAGGTGAGYAFSDAERIGLMSELMQAARQATQVTFRADDVDFSVYDVTFRAN